MKRKGLISVERLWEGHVEVVKQDPHLQWKVGLEQQGWPKGHYDGMLSGVTGAQDSDIRITWAVSQSRFHILPQEVLIQQVGTAVFLRLLGSVICRHLQQPWAGWLGCVIKLGGAVLWQDHDCQAASVITLHVVGKYHNYLWEKK